MVCESGGVLGRNEGGTGGERVRAEDIEWLLHGLWIIIIKVAAITAGQDFSAGVGAIHEVATTCDNKLKQSEESLWTVLFLSCWGPNLLHFVAISAQIMSRDDDFGF